MARERTKQIREAIEQEVFWSRRSPVLRVARRFGISQQAVRVHVQNLVSDGVLEGEGERRHRRYRLRELLKRRCTYVLDDSLQEADVWTNFFVPLFGDHSVNDEDICNYGVTEMVNNARDHSGGNELTVSLSITHASVQIRIADNGIGIFQKIATALRLPDPRLSLIELSKGKLTTDPARHTGEGVFFTSRAFDKFYIRSSNLFFHHSTRTDDWLVDVRDENFVGTRITMGLLTPSSRMMADTFAKFTLGGIDSTFAKTHVPIELAAFGDESLVSRSSAKRVLSRVDRFSEVMLDFAGVRSVGQAFADEIFRVYANGHPAVKLIYVNANAQVTGMIRRAEATKLEGPRIISDSEGPSLFEP